MAKEVCGSVSSKGRQSQHNATHSSFAGSINKRRGLEVSNARETKRRGPAEAYTQGHRARASDKKREWAASRENSASGSPDGSITEAIVPRSKAEADILHGTNNTSRHRQLPCRTFISTGFCPYKEHCVYLHDPRLMSSHQVCIHLSLPYSPRC
jgi:hypothetical protein